MNVQRGAPKILIVDDTAMNLDLLQRVLEAEGFRTITAENGPMARRLCQADSPDLILLDVMMPGESGFETCSSLKLDPRTADIPVIFLSALDDVKSKVQGLKSGGVDYVSKPMHGEEVLARVRVHLRIRENNRALVREQQAKLEELRNAQQAILVRPADCPAASFAVYYRPLEETGGDFYDVLALNEDVFAYFVADVSGHGSSAAFLTSAVKALLRQYSSPLYSPEDAMRGVDSVMRQMMGDEQYLTACYARLNRRSRRLTVVSAGHPPLIAVSSSGVARIVEMDSDPLGLFGTLTLQKKEIRVAPGERFYLFSDGLIESTPGGGRRKGIEKLVEACILHRGLPLAECLPSIVGSACGLDSAPTDDLVLLGVDVTGVDVTGVDVTGVDMTGVDVNRQDNPLGAI
jgi:sigma-B regulation protein RsbU (phosphoserine phosphatase)